MRIFSKISLTVIATSTLILSGCQPYTQPQSQNIAQIPEAPNSFNLQGKIGVKTPAQSGSAFFTWVQQLLICLLKFLNQGSWFRYKLIKKSKPR